MLQDAEANGEEEENGEEAIDLSMEDLTEEEEEDGEEAIDLSMEDLTEEEEEEEDGEEAIDLSIALTRKTCVRRKEAVPELQCTSCVRAQRRLR